MRRTHDVLDRRSLDLHRLIVQRVRERPELMAKVRANLRRWADIVAPSSQPYVAAWQALADQGDEAVLAAAVATGERATAMRQASPFAGVLDEAERVQFLNDWADQERLRQARDDAG